MTDRLERPVFVVGSPRSGTTLAQNLLCRDPSAYRLGRESRFIWHRLGGQEIGGSFPGRDLAAAEYIRELYRGERPWTHEEQRRWALRCASQGTPAQYLDLPHDLLEELSTGEVGPFAQGVQTETAPFTLPPLDPEWALDSDGPIRMVDKDTGHCWRLPELSEAFPDARFVFVVRDPVDAIRSLVAGWRHPVWFFTYRVPFDLAIEGYSEETPGGRSWWNFNLFEGWESLGRTSLAEVASRQWEAAMVPVVRHGLALVEQGRGMFVSYERLVADPEGVLGRLAEFAELDASSVIGDGLDRVYMSMASGTFDPGSGDLEGRARSARGVLDPIAHLLG